MEYEFSLPEQPSAYRNPEIIWKSDCTLSPEIRERLFRIISWQSQEGIVDIAGRSVIVSRKTRRRAKYNAIQLSGIGYLPFDITAPGTSTCTSNTFQPPSTNNFIETHPQMHTWFDADDNGQFTTSRTDVRYTGGYTAEEAETKYANTALVLSWKDKPFLSPIPYGIGYYPQVVGEKGPLHFLIFGVPFKGNRYVDLRNGLLKSTPGEFDKQFYYVIEQLAISLRYIHDKGYFHGQPHLGNCSAKGELFFLGDFATIRPARHKNAKLYDLFTAIRGAMIECNNLLPYDISVSGPKQRKITGEIVYRMVKAYTGISKGHFKVKENLLELQRDTLINEPDIDLATLIMSLTLDGIT